MFRPNDRGLLDFLAATVAVVAVYTSTPVGGLVDRATRKVLGLGPPGRPLTAYFDTASDMAEATAPGARIAEQPVSQPGEQDKNLAKVRSRELEPALARAFAVVASGGVVTLDDARNPWYDVRPLPHHPSDRAALGLVVREAEGTGLDLGHALARRLADANDLLGAYRRELGGVDAALAAYAVGSGIVRRAVDRARVLGSPSPARLDEFRDYLTRRDAETAERFVTGVQALRVAYAMDWPVPATFPITSTFGMRNHPIYGARRHHDGIDLGAPEGTPVRAVHAGKVTYAGSDGTNGLYVKVDHGYGIRTAYCHASRLGVSQGEEVERGQIIAWVGATGRATGPHLHYGVFVGARPVDPLVFRPPDAKITVDPGGAKGGEP